MQTRESKVISKSVGKSYEVEWDVDKRTVRISSGRKFILFNFNSFCESVDFYASLKSVKEVKNTLLYAEILYGVKFSSKK